MLAHWGRSLERFPRLAAKCNEEELRDLAITVLNTHNVGLVGGETFNGHGKTDILVREDDRNVLIAEAKVWRGPKSVADALDQVLGYAVWRDRYVALIVFIRGNNAIDKTATALQALQAHPRWRESDHASGSAELRTDHVFAHVFRRVNTLHSPLLSGIRERRATVEVAAPSGSSRPGRC